tara:strand:- start:1431 stop:2405 length:975 start_codon:yes stop_codon:yes gene_type:complete
MNHKPLIVVAGEPFSIFSEIFLKIYKKKIKKTKFPIILIVSKKLFQKQMHKLNYSYKLKILKEEDVLKKRIDNKYINLIDVNFKFKKTFDKISYKSSKYIENCFKIALNILKKNKAIGMINGPVSKKFFLKKKHLGITEYLSRKSNISNFAMLIFNDKISVSPVTTHMPLKYVYKHISKKKIVNNIIKIHQFYKKYLNRKVSVAVLGLNPHCETTDNFSEEDKIITPAIKTLKRGKINVKGPYPADTFFQSKNLLNFDVVVGMYHDQVLTPIKTLYKFDAINITLGLPYIRISPDHGTNNQMIGKNQSDPQSLYSAIKFFNKIK